MIAISFQGAQCANLLRKERLKNQFQRKLNLARCAGGLADDSKAAAAHYVGRQSEIHAIENVEELRAELQCAQFAVAAMSRKALIMRYVRALSGRRKFTDRRAP